MNDCSTSSRISKGAENVCNNNEIPPTFSLFGVAVLYSFLSLVSSAVTVYHDIATMGKRAGSPWITARIHGNILKIRGLTPQNAPSISC